MGFLNSVKSFFGASTSKSKDSGYDKDILAEQRIARAVEGQLGREEGEDYDRLREMREHARIAARMQEDDARKEVRAQEIAMKREQEMAEIALEDLRKETAEEREARELTEQLTREGVERQLREETKRSVGRRSA